MILPSMNPGEALGSKESGAGKWCSWRGPLHRRAVLRWF